MAKTTRRDFIKSSAAAAMLPLFDRQAKGVTVVEALREALVADNKILVIVELAGGNDPLNTIVPLQQYDIYKSFRSRLAIAKEQVLPLYGSTTMGLSPLFSAVKPIADAGKFAVVQSAHYPNPNLSHDGSRTIYRLADTATTVTSQAGWIDMPSRRVVWQSQQSARSGWRGRCEFGAGGAGGKSVGHQCRHARQCVGLCLQHRSALHGRPQQPTGGDARIARNDREQAVCAIDPDG
ncbi:MAG: hypothetical protein U0X75_25055 [Acidobacteriota bacterium]